MGEWMLVLAAGAVRLAYCVAWTLSAVFREGVRARNLAALARAAGPGAVVLDRRADGVVTAVWTHHAAQAALTKRTEQTERTVR